MVAKRNNLLGHIGLFIENTKLSVLSAMEYKFNFILQTVGMIVNDIFWIALWWFLFTRFGDINGWVFKDMILLYSILSVSFGLANSFFNGARKLQKTITDGRLDYYLVLPKNILFHASLKTSYGAVGDLVFGLILLPFSINLFQLPLYIYFVICATILFIAITIIFNSLAFFIGNSEKIRQTADEGFLTFAGYPLSVYSGSTKFILLTIFPAAFITGIPVETINSFNWTWFALTGVVSVVFLAIAIIVFYLGLRKYESGNLLYSKD